MKRVNVNTYIAMLLLVSNVSQADTMRCGNDLVRIGDSEEDVLRKCGRPYAMRDLFDEQAPAERVDESTPPYRRNIVWVYRPEGGKFEKSLTFQGGVLTAIVQAGSDTP